MCKYLILLTIAGSLITPVVHAQPKPAPECRSQQVEKSRVEMCLVRGAAFQHDIYMLRVDGAPIFALIDDYAEQVELTHALPEGLTIELPLSQQGGKVVKIVGGCLSESKDGAEVARVCNFHLGKHHVVKDQRFEFH
ncbi:MULTISPECIES: hypothetical protein [Variovorax]|uniref:hypothetical protein n=1 Tax=Variovorax TaxID=34072 RepID=UPI0028663864|nr:hypothetical protein [Variovorax sp. 3319]MDR6887408.1 hypothetical protein [Variovorax sp. 3319]